MKAINVPRQYEHMLRKSKGSTDEYKPLLRKYIEQMEGTVLTAADFQKTLNVSSAIIHVKKLMKLGYITRKTTGKGRGRAFVYTWHSVPLHHTQAALKNGEVVTTSLNLPDLPMDQQSLDKLSDLCIEWFDKEAPSAEQTAGALLFRRFCETKYREVEAQREKILIRG